MHILAIETSCDETAAAVVKEDRNVLSNVVVSQIQDHAPFGGVVPEIASRRHIELIRPTVDRSLEEAAISLEDLDGIAVTQGPGLVGALLVGISFAKGLSYGLGIPLCGINHLEGHLNAAWIENDPRYPHIGMVISGGHTSIYNVEGPGRIVEIGHTLDDAAGEAFDKVSKLLGLGYPGGIEIERISREIDADSSEIVLPRPMISDNSYNFSFSGLKTAVLKLVMELDIFPDKGLRFSGLPKAMAPKRGKEHYIPQIAHAFQEAVFDVLEAKALKALKDFEAKSLVVTGGVASNSRLRNRLALMSKAHGVDLVIPDKRFCTDNAAMIGIASIRCFTEGRLSDFSMNALSRWQIP